MPEYSGSITIYGSNTDIVESMPLSASITALSDAESVTLEFYKVKIKPELISDEYIDGAGNKSGNKSYEWLIRCETKNLDYANEEYFIDYHSIYKPLRKEFKWIKLSNNYMHHLIDGSLSTPNDRALAVHVEQFDTPDDENEQYYYNIDFKNRKPL